MVSHPLTSVATMAEKEPNPTVSPQPGSTRNAPRRRSTAPKIDHRLYRPFKTLPEDARMLVGQGHEVIVFDHAITDAMVVHITHDGPGHYSFRFLVEDGQHHSEMISGSGQHLGSYPINMASRPSFRYVEVKADGDWTVEFRPLSESRTLKTRSGSKISGEHCEVIQFAAAEPTRIRVVAPDAEALILNALGMGYRNLLLRHQPFDGRLLVPAKTLGLSVFVRGGGMNAADWAITVG